MFKKESKEGVRRRGDFLMTTIPICRHYGEKKVDLLVTVPLTEKRGGLNRTVVSENPTFQAVRVTHAWPASGR
jgi:hypothetical protein